MNGAFFPHPDFQVPEEEMGQHAGYDVVVPSWKLTHLVVENWGPKFAQKLIKVHLIVRDRWENGQAFPIRP
jgi:hypothetical protein